MLKNKKRRVFLSCGEGILPWENTHCDFFKVLKFLEESTFALFINGYKLLFNAAKGLNL